MNRKSILLVAIALIYSAFMYLALRPAVAMEISWYEQRAPGHAAGEVRITDLAEGEFEFETPGRNLEYGIARHGDIAVVILADSGGRPAKPGSLLLVARQGGRTARATYPLAMPAPVVRERDVVPDPSIIESAGFAAPGPSSAPVPPDVAAPVPEPPAVCPLLVIAPGSLYATAARLLAECGHELGNWNPGNEETIVDFEVSGTRTVENDDGIEGLLKVFQQYGLVRVVRPGTDIVDIYEL